MNPTASIFVALLGALALLGCSSASAAPARPTPSYALPSLPARPAFDPNAQPSNARQDQSISMMGAVLESAPTGQTHDVDIHGPIFHAPAARAVGSAMDTVTHGLAGKQRGATAGFGAAMALPTGEASKGEEKIEREAQLAIEVDDTTAAAARVTSLVGAHSGSITKDERTTGRQSHVEIIVRVPSDHFDAFVSELARVGEIRNVSIKALDTSLEHKDLGILVDNLEAALARYRDLLQKATDPLQVLAVERELERVRSDLDRIKGRLAFLKDRVARATVSIALHSHEPPSDWPHENKPQISSGLRGLSFVDVRESGTSGYLGTGLTVRLPRSGGTNARGFILDVDVMRACCKARPDRSRWAYDILVGMDLYSESLQSGRRRWFNPYLGARFGLANTQDRIDFAMAGVFGLEILKTSALMIDIQARAMAMVGNPDGPHAAVQPSLGFDVGF